MGNSRIVKDLVGQRFGLLTVLEADMSKSNKPYWICECDCGTIKSVLEYRLLSGNTTSCGSHASERTRQARFRDISGQRFGKLTVLYHLPFEKGKSTTWVCKCDCGNETVAETAQLIGNHKRSCGCLVAEATRKANTVDHTGHKWARLTALYPAPRIGNERIKWVCRCDCGNLVEIYTNNIGKTKSCGCLRRENIEKDFIGNQLTHGGTHERLYKIWYGAVDRCYHQYVRSYRNYGGRGIKVADEWLGKDGYANFRKWAYENGYDENALKGQCTLDRIDVNGDYSPSNCRWANMTVQQNNKRNTPYFEIGGMTHTLAEWCAIYNVPVHRVRNRIYCGWDIVRALTEPSHRLNSR